MTLNLDWTTITEQQPPPHQQYLVCRENKFFTCTPCYGMHSPWWVTLIIQGDEADPTPMKIDDRWCLLPKPKKKE